MDLEMLDRVATQYCGLAKEKPVLVGVSGGPDSLCLLHSLKTLGFSVVASHVNHQIRPEARAEAEQVRLFCEQLEVPFLYHQVDVRDFSSKNKLSLEESARILRYDCLMRSAKEVSAQALAVAHQADDQVETLLMHILRGAGASGLKGMSYRSYILPFSADIPVVRPLLGVWRQEILTYCQEHQIIPCQDESNSDTVYFRNRIRHELIPELATYNSRASQHLWQLSQIIGEEDRFLQDSVKKYLAEIVEYRGIGFFTLDRQAFSGVDIVIQRRLVRLVLSTLRSNIRDISMEQVEKAVLFLTDKSSHGEWQIMDDVHIVALPQHQALIFTDEAKLEELWPLVDRKLPEVIFWPGELQLNQSWKLRSQVMKRSEIELPDNENIVCFDLDRLASPLTIATRKAGERFIPFGMSDHTMKLGDYFTNNHYPAKARDRWPVLSMGEQVLWIVGLRRSSIAPISDTTTRVLCLELIREG
jgi:tRNA(Ile)-lysidine synthase